LSSSRRAYERRRLGKKKRKKEKKRRGRERERKKKRKRKGRALLLHHRLVTESPFLGGQGQ